MLQDVSIWLYDIKKCGYYTLRGPDARAPLFGDIDSTCAALQRWSAGKFLGQTATYGAAEGDEQAEAYLLDLHRGAHGDYLVGIWNRLPGNRHHVSSIGIGDIVGAASAEVTAIDRNRIPGFATYFWVMPEQRRVAAIGLKHLSHGLINFGNYVSGFLKFIHPDHVVLAEQNHGEDIIVQGYKEGADDEPYQAGVKPFFSVRSIPRGGELDYLRANVGAISRVQCKTVITTMEPGERNWLQSMLDISRIPKAPPPNIEEAQIKVDFPVSLTLEELNSSIEQWEEDISDSSENDLGFKVAGKMKWLRKSHARQTRNLDVQWVDDELVDFASLLQQLQVHRANVLAMG